MKKTTRKSRSLTRALAMYASIPAVTVWMIAMCLLTWASANHFFRQLEDDTYQSFEVSADALPGTPELIMLDRLGAPFYQLNTDPLLPIELPQSPRSYGSDDWYWGKWELVTGCQFAVGYYDRSGKPIVESGDYLYFSYAFQFPGDTVGYAYIDLDELEGGAALADRYIQTLPAGDTTCSLLLGTNLRMTGYFEGNRFYPVTIGDIYSVEAPGRELVSIVANDLQGYNYDPGRNVPAKSFLKQIRGADANIGAYVGLEELLPYSRSSTGVSVNHLWNAWICQTARTADGGRFVLLIYCSPLRYALLRLTPMYLISGQLLMAALIWICRRIRHKLTEPLSAVYRALEGHRPLLGRYEYTAFAETDALAQAASDAVQARHQLDSEIQQLRTALDYAKHAEESRRKMVSAVAHELKTPLAVIHSYAEGLQTGIAAEKRDKYLSVIQNETEHMSDMVQQMLELSRLEAGKVTLHPETVDLTRLTQDVFDKLAPAAQARSLQVTLELEDAVTVSADPARLAQVITNFASNAVKYTTEGGAIRVWLTDRVTSVQFSMANDCTPLAPEEVEQLWDAFYRADTARDRSGTGLGLSIAKSIIQLHRGTCSAQATDTGMVFSFDIPQ